MAGAAAGGEKAHRPLIVGGNRLPVDQVTDPDGSTRWQRSPGGLVTALEPFVAGRGGAWVGWSGSAGEAPEPFESGGMSLIPVPLTEEEVDRYYEGMSNASLWPLYHDVVEKPEYHRTWWDTYVQVNKRFAERAAAVAANFVQLARRLHDLPARGQLIEYEKRTVVARAFPISIDAAAFDELARS